MLSVCLLAGGVFFHVLKNQPGSVEEAEEHTPPGVAEHTDHDASAAPADATEEDAPTAPGGIVAKSKHDHGVSPTAKPAAPPKDYTKLPKTHPQRRYGAYLEKGYGKMEPVKREDSIAAAAVFEALETKTHPERISAMVQGAKFDPQKYENDDAYKQEYLALSEPGRCWQHAQPGPGVPHIKRISPYYQKAHQSDSVELSVQAAALLPVTFTTMSGGQFSNKLTSITVEADSRGYAAVQFRSGGGVIADCNILAASPGASGVARLKVDVFKDDEDLNEQ